MSVCGTGIWGVPEPINPDLNASALTATAGTLGIYVRWTLNELTLPGVSHTRLYRGTAAEYALATPLQNIKGDYYFDAINDIADPITYYYWIRHIAVDGQIGNLIGPAAATFNGAIQAIIERLSGQLDETHLSASLKTDIDTIAILAESLAQETINRTTAYQLLTEALATASGDFDDVRTAIIQEVNSRQTADSAQIESINAFGIKVGLNEGAIIDEIQLRVDGDEANASLISGLTTRVENAEGAISTEATTRAEEDQALAQLITNLDVSIDGKVAAAISEVDLVAANGYCEIGGNPSTTILTEDACTGSGGTWISTGQMAASNKTFVTQTNNSISGLNGTVGEHTDSIGSLQTTMGVATGQLGQIKVHYMVKLSASAANGKQLIGGFGLYNDGTTIDAGFEVDRFWIGRSVMGGGSTPAVKPFMVDGGTVYMDTAVIKNASITDAKIGSLSVDKITGLNASFITARVENLSADKLTAGTITGLTLRTASSGRRVEISGGNQNIMCYAVDGTPRVGIGVYNGATVNTSLVAIDGVSGGGNTHRGLDIYTVGFAIEAQSTGTHTAYFKNWNGYSAVYADTQGTAAAAIKAIASGVALWGDTQGASVGVAGFGTAVSGGVGVQGIGYTYGGYFEATNNSYAVHLGNGGAVHAFTGGHEALIVNGVSIPDVGDIVVITHIVNKSSVFDVIPAVKACDEVESKAVYGVMTSPQVLRDFTPKTEDNRLPEIMVSGLSNLTQSEYEAIQATHSLITCNGLGEGQINVCSANGNFECGDFICTSAVPGKGQRYDGNDMRVVVAKCLEPVDWSTEPETTKMVACIYMCS